MSFFNGGGIGVAGDGEDFVVAFCLACHVGFRGFVCGAC